MDDREKINKLFDDAIKMLGVSVLPGTKEVFSKLAGISLEYRDELVKKGLPALTVEEVKSAIDIFQQTTAKGVLPKTVPIRLIPLIEKWLSAFN